MTHGHKAFIFDPDKELSPFFFHEELDQSRLVRVRPLQFVLAGWFYLFVGKSVDFVKKSNS